jgi:hypothetical protein
MSSRRHALVALLATFTIVSSAACGGKDQPMQRTATKAEAAARVETLVQEGFAQLPPGAALSALYRHDDDACDGTGGALDGTIFAEHKFEVKQPANGWPADKALPTLVTYWQQQGYHVHADKRTEPDPWYSVTTSDNYAVTIRTMPRGGGHIDVYLSATSPCVWENGMPSP